MRLLGIETSCDETAAAVVEDGRKVMSNSIATSRQAFSASGGVIPEEAARRQVECMVPVLHQALEQAVCTPADIDGIAVTRGPGLSGSLLVGTSAARALASLWNKPLAGVHHTLGHLCSPWLECTTDPEFPVLSLSASGGHSDIWYRTSHTEGRLLGTTRDDAAGEAFDKGAALLGLPYPGGPSIQKAAAGGSRAAFPFPLPLRGGDTLDFSFSGLKTALRYTLRDLGEDPADRLADLAASYEHALCRHLLDRLQRAAALHDDVREIHIVGGVSANRHLRELTEAAFPSLTIRYPTAIPYCTDNAAMIAAAAFFTLQERGEDAWGDFRTAASLPDDTVLRPA